MKKAAMARAIGVSRPTLDVYLDMPGAPQPVGHDYDFDQVKAFVQANAKSQTVAVSTNEDFKELKKREMRAKCEKMEHLLAVQKGRYVAVEKVEKLFVRWMFKSKGALLGGQNGLILKLVAITGFPDEVIRPKIEERDRDYLLELKKFEYDDSLQEDTN